MKLLFICISVICTILNVFANPGNKPLKVSENLEILQISKNAYVHISYSESQWGRISSNGMILVQNNKAFLFDSPMDEATTIELMKFITDSLRAVVTGFVPNHWHSDCIGGLDYLHKKNVKSFANQLTIDLAIKNRLPVPANAFYDSLLLKLDKLEILCFFPGAAHSTDNIVVWVPSEKILFGGCMVKDLNAKNMGNFVDGDLKAWPATILKVMNRFPSAEIVIPGHGSTGNFSLLEHTYKLALAHAE